jgi:hypothetical protein
VAGEPLELELELELEPEQPKPEPEQPEQPEQQPEQPERSGGLQLLLEMIGGTTSDRVTARRDSHM